MLRSCFIVMLVCAIAAGCSSASQPKSKDEIPSPIIRLGPNGNNQNIPGNLNNSGNQPPTFQTALFDFGGMYSESGQGFDNPLTGEMNCPAGYLSSQVLGSEGEDAELFYCRKPLAEGDRPFFHFGGFYAKHSSGEYENPITGDSSCPSGFQTHQVYGDSNWDFDLFICTRTAPVGVSWPFGFGGFFGEKRFDSGEYPHVSTNDLRCPESHFSFSVLGSSEKDWPLKVCLKILSQDDQFQSVNQAPTVSFNPNVFERGHFAFGGMYSSFTSSSGSQSGFRHPLTNDFRCPDSYKEHQVRGRPGGRYPDGFWLDWSLFICYRDDLGPFDLALYDFGGAYGLGTDWFNHLNPVTGAQSCMINGRPHSSCCPSGYQAHKVIDSTHEDWPFVYCYREQTRNQPTEFSFGGFWSEVESPHSLNREFENIGSLGFGCPSGHSSSKVHGAGNSDHDARLFMCSSEIVND